MAAPADAGGAGGTDADLLHAHTAGDPEAFGELFRRHRDRLWAVALRTMGNREDAADALQDALLSAHRAAARFRGDSAVTTWLHRIVVNACLDRIRRRRAHPTVPLPEYPSGIGVEPAAPPVDRDTVLVVQDALAQLPADQRAAIVLVDLHGYSVAEAAEIFEVAEGTVKSRCSRGRARLAGLLGYLRGAEPAGAREAPAPAEQESVPRSGSRQLGGLRRAPPSAGAEPPAGGNLDATGAVPFGSGPATASEGGAE